MIYGDYFIMPWFFLCPLGFFSFECSNRQATINTFDNIFYLGLHSSLNFNVHDFGFPQLNERDRETPKMHAKLKAKANEALPKSDP